MTRDLIVGIDSSTTATKAIAWDRRGNAIAEGRAPIPLSNPQPGYFEQDPEDWWSSTRNALRDLTGSVSADRIAGVAISNQRETFGLFAEDGQALRPALLWLDDRAQPQQHNFGKTFGPARVHAISGKPLDIIPCLYRMIWLKENEADLFAKAGRFSEVHGYLSFRLTGQWTSSTASADPTGMFDMEKGEWSETILDAAGIRRSLMPPLKRPGDFLGEVTAQAASETGLKEGTPLITGGGDGQCAGTGVGVLQAGRAYINLGTAVVAGTFGRTYVHDLAFRTETAVAEEGFIFETCLRSGMFLIDWLTREMLNIKVEDRAEFLSRLESEAARSPTGAGGVVVLPYWQGSMTPHWDSSARGVIAGLSGSTKRGDIYRALLEGVALDQAHALGRTVAVTGMPIDRMTAIGGGAASSLFVQIIADVLNQPVYCSSVTEASSLGAAMAAAKGVGWYGSIVEASAAMSGKTIKTFEPDPGRAASYSELRLIYDDLWPMLSSWNRRLYDFANRAAQNAS